MRNFILRARKGPTSPNFSLDDLSRAGRLEIVAHCLANALFYSKNIRTNTMIHLVFDGPSDPPKTVRFESDHLGYLGGFDERTLARVVQKALAAGVGLPLGEERQVDAGLFVVKKGFEHVVKTQEGPLFVLERKGSDIRSVTFEKDATFVFADHLTMPKKTDKYLRRLGAVPICVGPKMLFASPCIVLVHNELDRQGL